METYNGIICIMGSELIKSESNPGGVMSLSYYTNLVSENKINRVRRASKDTPALIEYDSLPIKYRQAWEALHGDPNEVKKMAPFYERLYPDIKAQNEFAKYRYNNQALDQKVQEAYSKDASIFNAITETITQMRGARGGRKMQGMWDDIFKLVDQIREVWTPNNMPSTALTLKRKYDRYMQDGYTSLIHKGYGNNNKAIIKGKLSEATLLDLLCYGNQLSMPSVAEHYNIFANSSKYPEITERTVLNYYKKNKAAIDLKRKGVAAWENMYNPVTGRYRPSCSLMLVNYDDNDLDLYFTRKIRNKQGKLITDNYYRPKLYVVLDAHCDYILGYAVGDTVNKALIKEALRNAANHIKELTGSYFLWHQSTADHFGLNGDLKDYFKNISKFTPATATKARPKIIEQSFGKKWHDTLKIYPNYAGYNITAKQKSNPDFIEKNIKNHPTLAQGLVQIEEFINLMRTIDWKDGVTRQEAWLDNFWENEQSRELYISPELYYSKFGIQNEYTNTITNKGVIVTINEIKYRYDIPEELYLNAVGRKVKVTYDPADLSKVYLTGDHISFIATEHNNMPMALGDYKQGDLARLQAELDKKRRLRQSVDDKIAEINEIVEMNGTSAQSLLQAGKLDKIARFQASAIAQRASLGDDTNISNII